ncbi:hypothetical protein VLK81_01085 [Citroniella saccharovorans]|uniref:Uncharacterized protein n=1 Tax=Citroniella saccharovorans TaxID=2053367 RepID=A0AAW9MNP0_9FIRM|nr:hypothetical protein [Citroniella saccharovorans]MEB3428631.1 hypothetical protein [Citroniella saccharovorans]
MAAKEEGIKEAPCIFADHLNEAQKKAYILADNRMALDRAIRCGNDTSESVYDDRGLIVF